MVSLQTTTPDTQPMTQVVASLMAAWGQRISALFFLAVRTLLGSTVCSTQSIVHDQSYFLSHHARCFVPADVVKAVEKREASIHLDAVVFNDFEPGEPLVKSVQISPPENGAAGDLYFDLHVAHGTKPLELLVWMGRHVEGMGRFRIELGELIQRTLRKYGGSVYWFEDPVTIAGARQLADALGGWEIEKRAFALPYSEYNPAAMRAPEPVPIPWVPKNFMY